MSVLTVPAAKAHLNIAGNNNDADLQLFIDAAEAAISTRVGPLAATAVTRQVRGGGQALVLPVLPAISLTSVTPLGSPALILTDLSLDTATGLVTHVYPYLFWPTRHTVVYQAGRATLPNDLLMAVKEMVRHLWTTQRGASGRPGSKASDTLANTLPGSAYALPMRVEQLLAPHVRAGFF